MLLNLFDFNHLLTPIAIVLRVRLRGNIMYKTLHVFGIRVAYWTVHVNNA